MAINAPQKVDNIAVEEVPSLLIPMGGCTLLVPTVSIAEMAPFSHASAEQDAPDWYLGKIQWRDQLVPLLSYEMINGEACPTIHSRCRVAVFNNTGVSEELPFFALPTQGIPRLARVTADELSQRQDEPTKAFELMHVSLAGEHAVIPNVDALERAYLDYRSGCGVKL